MKFFDAKKFNFNNIKGISKTQLDEHYNLYTRYINAMNRVSIEMVINSTFGSYKNFIDKFKCIGLSMRGWVILCYDHFSNDYYIYGQDSHNTEISMNTYPIIVMDVYEHAYMIDFGIDKSKYIDAFFNNLDFKVINNRFNI